MSKEERNIQKIIRDQAKEEINAGKKMKIW